MSGAPLTLTDRLVLSAILGGIALVVYAAWRGTIPSPPREERRADAPARTWTTSCAACHASDGLGITGRGGDVTRAHPGDADELRRLLDRPAHPPAVRSVSDRQVEEVLEHLRVLGAGGAP